MRKLVVASTLAVLVTSLTSIAATPEEQEVAKLRKLLSDEKFTGKVE